MRTLDACRKCTVNVVNLEEYRRRNYMLSTKSNHIVAVIQAEHHRQRARKVQEIQDKLEGKK